MLSTLVVCCYLSADPIATQFDFPIQPRENYHVAENAGCFDLSDYNGQYHLGEDWNGNGGQSTDKGDPVYCIAAGRVVKVDNTEKKNSWGKVIVIAHTLPDLQIVYSVYAHLQKVLVSKGEVVGLGQKIGKIGDANRFYQGQAHLHFALMKRGPFPPKARGYEQELSWDTIDDYYIPTLFISNRRSPMTVKLSSGGWKEFTVPSQTPVSTAYVEVKPLFGDKQYYSLTEALTNGTLRPVIKYSQWGFGWEKIGPNQLEDFIFSPDFAEYALRSKLSSVAYTVKLIIFPLMTDEEIMALRAKSDFLWSAHAYGPQFIRPLPETFSFHRLTWSDGSFLSWFAQMSYEVTGEIPSSRFYDYSGLMEAPLLGRQPLFVLGLTDDFLLPAVSPNKVD